MKTEGERKRDITDFMFMKLLFSVLISGAGAWNLILAHDKVCALSGKLSIDSYTFKFILPVL